VVPGSGEIEVKRGQAALDVLKKMLTGDTLKEVERKGAALIFQFESGYHVSLEVWNGHKLPIQIKLGMDAKEYFEGSFSQDDGLTLFERGLF